ncbi:MAG TPA: YraN family protein [Eubacteriales bacterium]|nr:YraN family protein [Eubacteriales bacterium]
MNTRLLGGLGEKQAVMYLKKHHYKIIETNYFCRFGEIDIIAKKDNILIFVEVKSRADNSFGSPAEAVTPRKQQKIITVAKNYIAEHGVNNTQIRFDVVEIIDKKTNHILDAFRVEN